VGKILNRRVLGPVNTEMGGNSDPSSNSGGSVTIENNIDGYVLKATGQANKVKGIPELRWNESNVALTGSGDLYVSGSNNYLYLHGTNSTGETVRFRVGVSGSILKVLEDNPEGSI
jgi:hypothetical protein|tara:strand:- start:2029 stop:2376 length:348 start_codon:yes stop_codon:yes gene_type:complete